MNKEKLKYLFVFIFLPFVFKTPAFAADIVINEFQVQPSGSSQWVELYNKRDQTVNLLDWVIDDSGGSSNYKISAVDLLPHQCISFQSGKFYFNTASSDTVRLIYNEQVADSYSYSQSPGDNVSFGRLPDGSDNWVTFSSPTKDKLNVDGSSCLAPTVPPTVTPTPSPLPTPTPTKSPTPTKTPTPAPTLKPTSTSKPTPTSSRQLAVNTVSVLPSTNSLDGKQVISKEVLPTSVLGEDSQSSSQPSNIGKNPSAGSSGKVLGASQNNLSKILIGLGIISFLACGILVFRNYKKRKEINE